MSKAYKIISSCGTIVCADMDIITFVMFSIRICDFDSQYRYNLTIRLINESTKVTDQQSEIRTLEPMNAERRILSYLSFPVLQVRRE